MVAVSGHLEFGQFGEEAAACWYAANGYSVVDRNWSCPLGELDLIVRSTGRESPVVAFVEVKTRRSDRFGSGFDAVTVDKQRRLRRLAGQWLALSPRGAVPRDAVVRFDVVDVDGRGHIQVIEDAF